MGKDNNDRQRISVGVAGLTMVLIIVAFTHFLTMGSTLAAPGIQLAEQGLPTK